MKHAFGTLACILFVSLVSTGLRAGEEVGERNRFGFGMSLGGSFSVDMTGDVNFYFPIRIGENIRIEPEFGIMYSSWDFEYEGETYNGSERIIRIGIGVMPVIQRGKLDMYYGLRTGVHLAALEDPARTIYSPEPFVLSYSRTDWYIAPAFGGEYFVSSHFSVGGEVQLEFMIFSDYDDYSRTTDVRVIQNRNLFFVRWYF